MDFDVVIADPAAMRVVGQLGQILGPRGLMPNPKTGTVTMDIGKAVTEVKAGKIDFRVDKFGIVHSSVAKASFDQPLTPSSGHLVSKYSRVFNAKGQSSL